MSALRASETPSIAASPANAARTVLLPGSPATYANRAFLKGLGLRWDPEGHRWHGTTSEENIRALREQLGLEVRCFVSLDVAPSTEIAPKDQTPPSPTRPPIALVSSRRPRVHDGSRTHLESRVAFPLGSEEVEEATGYARRFTPEEITSGLRDDSREADKRAEARRACDLRGRVKAARAVVSNTPGLSETLQKNWTRAASFYARFGITEL
jgi:hypothetical protein